MKCSSLRLQRQALRRQYKRQLKRIALARSEREQWFRTCGETITVMEFDASIMRHALRRLNNEIQNLEHGKWK